MSQPHTFVPQPVASWPSLGADPSGKRRAPRRRVELPCEVISRHADAPILHWATDLSPFGLWLEAPMPLSPGEELVVCFEPPVGWPRDRELVLFAGVTRAGWGRREADLGAAGMALDFIDLSEHERRALTSWLSWRPLRPPRRFGAPQRSHAPSRADGRGGASDIRARRECAHLAR